MFQHKIFCSKMDVKSQQIQHVSSTNQEGMLFPSRKIIFKVCQFPKFDFIHCCQNIVIFRKTFPFRLRLPKFAERHNIFFLSESTWMEQMISIKAFISLVCCDFSDGIVCLFGSAKEENIFTTSAGNLQLNYRRLIWYCKSAFQLGNAYSILGTGICWESPNLNYFDIKWSENFNI